MSRPTWKEMIKASHIMSLNFFFCRPSTGPPTRLSMSLLHQISQNAQRRVQQSSRSFDEDEENWPLGPDTPL
jgi:hypothetical protein